MQELCICFYSGCDCDPLGSIGQLCNHTTGQCNCLDGFGGLKCDRCSSEIHFFSPLQSRCIPCECNEEGSSQCERDGRCVCKPGVRGERCDECRPDHFNFSSTMGCTLCNCYAMGSIRDDSVCDPVSGECECVEGVTGRKCDMCPVSYVGPNKNLLTPCTECFCNGYSKRCSPEDGWYQAEVASGFNEGGVVMEGFSTDGEIFSNQ